MERFLTRVLGGVLLGALGPGALQAQQADFLVRLAELARTAQPPEPLRGDIVLTGRVVTETAEPLEGVLIRAAREPERANTSWARPLVDAPPANRDLASVLEGSARYWFDRNRGIREATTDAEGCYVLAELAPGTYDIQAFRRGFDVPPPPGPTRSWFRLSANTTIDFVASAVVLQRFEVRKLDGTSVEQAFLQFDRLGSHDARPTAIWTPAQPATLLSAGDWYVTATISHPEQPIGNPRHAWFASERRLVTIAPHVDPELVTLDLRGVPAIEGEILMSPGSREHTEVHGVLLNPGQAPDPSLLASPNRSRDVKRAHAQWGSYSGHNYRLDDIAPGRWYVGVSVHPEPAPIVTAIVDVGEGRVVHDFTLPPPDTRGRLLVRVLDSEAAPLRDCTFDYTSEQRHSNGHISHQGGRVESDRTGLGAFRIPTTRFHERTVIHAVHPRFGTKSFPVVAGVQDYVIRFAVPAELRLRMPGFAENARGRVAQVLVEGAGGDDSTRRIENNTAAAEFLELGRLQPGAWRIRVELEIESEKRRDEFEIARMTVDLESGPREVVLPFPRLEVLRFAMPESQQGGLGLIPLDAELAEDKRNLERYAEPDEDRIVTFHDVPPGSYVATARGNERMIVQVPTSETIRFVAAPVRALRVVITDPAGPLARAGLASGDLVVAIAGREFESREALDRIRQSIRGSEVTLTIERKGEWFEVVIASDQFRVGDAGGRFVDALR